MSRGIARLLTAIACSTFLGACRYGWGIEHAPFIDGPGPGSGWVRVSVEGIRYDVDLHIPRRRTPGEAPTPLLVVLHGYNGTGPGMERRTGFSALADSAGFAVAYPNARKNAQGKRAWMGGDAAALDLAMLRALTDTVAHRVRVDRARVFLAGFSNGGALTYRAALALPNDYAGIGVVAGAYRPDTGALRMGSMGGSVRAIPLLAVHGTHDETVVFDRSAPLAIHAWARRNGCDVAPATDTLAAGAIIRTAYSSCRARARVVLYALVNEGHGWPRRRIGNSRFFAASTLWSFFSEYGTRDSLVGVDRRP